MKLIKVAKKDVEDGEILEQLDNLSKTFKVTAIRIDKDLNVNYAGRTVEAIERDISRLRESANRLLNEANAAADYVKKTKNEAKKLQSGIRNPKVLVS